MALNAKDISRLRIVIADDESFNLSLITAMVRDIGCRNIVTATDGAWALEALSDRINPPDALIVDFNMPAFNGLQILKLVRIDEAACRRSLPVLMLTGSSDAGLVRAAMALDVDAFLIKPVSRQVLSGRIDKLTKSSNRLRSVNSYANVDINLVGRALMEANPFGKSQGAAAPAPPKGVAVDLEAAPVGALLAEDIYAPSGELILGKKTRLSARLLARIQEVREVLAIDNIYIQDATPGKTS